MVRMTFAVIVSAGSGLGSVGTCALAGGGGEVEVAMATAGALRSVGTCRVDSGEIGADAVMTGALGT